MADKEGGEVTVEEAGSKKVNGSVVVDEEHEEPLSPSELSEKLMEGTKKSHEKAENTHFVKEFLKGRIKKQLFKLATVALYHVYTALEEEMDRNKDNPVFAPLYFPAELHRKAALEKDLQFFYGARWREEIVCSDAAQKYVERIRWIGEHEPELLVAHAYTRYMGDLSGGQVLKKVAQRALHLPASGEGLEFYTFDNVTNAGKFKQLYRSRMNSLELDAKGEERIVSEANRAFHFNIEVFDELERIGETVQEEASDSGMSVHDGTGDRRKCPYYAAQDVISAGAACPFHTAVAQLRSPAMLSVLAVCAVALAVVVALFWN
ncbi:heme oxygenase 2 [Petromyzon marinus]|uniref:heme oxygenase 2 n=1 Tax=Petromyzon marinus TaxID=7757 RepID=UPI003F72F31A